MPSDFACRCPSVEHESRPKPLNDMRTAQYYRLVKLTYFSLPSPTAIILLLSPSHTRSFLGTFRASDSNEKVSPAPCMDGSNVHSSRERLRLVLEDVLVTNEVPDAD